MTIYYFCPDQGLPSGGVKKIYRHAEILKSRGFPARILHDQFGFRCDWFEHNCSIAYLNAEGPFSTVIKKAFGKKDYMPKIYLGQNIYHQSPGRKVEDKLNSDDIIVLPEFYGKHLEECVQDLPMVIFNQGFQYTFRDYNFEDKLDNNVYLQKNLKGVLVVSKHDLEGFQHVFPSLTIFRVHNGIDGSMFQYRPLEAKEKQIAFMPGKRLKDLLMLINTLKMKGLLGGWKLVPIEKESERNVADILQRSAIFLNLVDQEGFGLPAAEAASCGCIVVGYDGISGKEFLHSDFCYPVPLGDVLFFIKTMGYVMDQYENHLQKLIHQTREFSRFIQKEYSMEKEVEDVTNAWHQLLGS